jgi:mannose-6-phosphate isomerase-like protein (cupin superfamily)
MGWHSTHAREELIIALAGSLTLELQRSPRRLRRVALRGGACVWLPSRTRHRVLNRSRAMAAYLYVTAASRGR